MRDCRWLLFLLVAACGTAPAISVVRTAAGDKTEEIQGDVVKLKRGEQEAFRGGKAGYYVIRTEDDWKAAWPSGKAPAMPDLETSHQMIFFTVADTKRVTRLKMTKSLETAERVFVWVKETQLGENCLNKAQERAFDAVSAPRIEKPVKFFIEEEAGESCGPPPTASASCRVVGQKDQPWAPKITAQPGDNVECELAAQARGKFELIEKNLTMADLPAGSTAKLGFAKGPQRGEFLVDVYGDYTVNAESVDEIGRRGKGAAHIDVKPPKTKDVLVQLVWAGFDIKDESDTFPRVDLRVAEEGPKGQRCSAEIPIPGLCEVKTRGAYTYMRIPEGKRRLPVSVRYMDERLEKGPGPCVHVWYDGARTAETCDRSGRGAEEIWRVGTLDTSTGLLSGGEGGAPPPKPASATPPAEPTEAPPPPSKKKKK